MSEIPWRHPECQPPELIEVLVAQALDDIDQRRLTGEEALRAIALTTWRIARTERAPRGG